MVSIEIVRQNLLSKPSLASLEIAHEVFAELRQVALQCTSTEEFLEKAKKLPVLETPFQRNIRLWRQVVFDIIEEGWWE